MTLRDFVNLANKYIELKEENKKLKDQLLVVQTNEETFRLEMKDITQTLGLDEDTIFDDVKSYVRSLKEKDKKETQQKEFIKYLEDEISKWHNNYDSYNYEHEVEEPTAEELVNEILQKYKKIIGLKRWKKK